MLKYAGTVVLMGLCVFPGYAQTTLDAPIGESHPYFRDSGLQQHPSNTAEAVYQEIVAIQDAGWLRVFFGEDVALEGASFIRITSLLDSEVQELDAATLEAWGHASAYFNGNALNVELIAGAGTTNNRIVIDHLTKPVVNRQALGGSGQCGICGSDDRVPSGEEWTSRLLPAGCTASVYTTSSCMVSAGHCIGGSMVVQFNVPNSNSNCSLNHPPVADQFPINNVNFTNGGVGNDWSVLIPGTNNLGELPYDRYGVLRPISPVVASPNDPVDVTGYGLDLTCFLSQTQQTDSGPLDDVFSTFYTYFVDVRGGNSGSSLIHNDEIIGIVTHCPCPNVATRIDHPNFVAARNALCPEPDCGSNAECNDNNDCTTDICDNGSCTNTPINCNDADACTSDGCDPGSGCVNTPINCDDGDACTIDSCDSGSGCVNDPVVCPPGESCVNGVCTPTACNNNGICESGEDCNNCPNDCIGGGSGSCGDGVCSGLAGGEDCFSCPADCRCAGGSGCNACCGDGSCSGPGEKANNCPVDCDPNFEPPLPSCCGDGFCEGNEDGFNCEIDCGPPAQCGDGSCDSGEDQCNCPQDCGTPPASEGNCSDGIDEDCDGNTDCDDADCDGDAACPSCLPKHAACSQDSECCSGDCKPNGTCR